uniref:Ig-like domain-containing protein n=1 Tax=Salmo trutta TaxID=8032 RepID=A0A673XNH7_SALTR
MSRCQLLTGSVWCVFLPFSHLLIKGSKGLLVRKQEGDTMTIHCSTSLPDQENLSVYMRWTKEIEVLYFYQATEKLTLHERFKLRLMTNGRLNKMDITITNLTIEDSGAYWCVYSVYKTHKNEKTEGEGAVLLVVNGECLTLPYSAVFNIKLVYLIIKLKNTRHKIGSYSKYRVSTSCTMCRDTGVLR